MRIAIQQGSNIYSVTVDIFKNFIRGDIVEDLESREALDAMFLCYGAYKDVVSMIIDSRILEDNVSLVSSDFNIIYTAIKKWQCTWRNDYINSAFEWRKSIELYSKIKSKLDKYLKELGDVKVVLYDPDVVNERVALDNFKKLKTS